MRFRFALLWISVLVTVASCVAACDGGAAQPSESHEATPATAIPTYTFEVVNTYPHDATAFTQGLVYLNGNLFESTGLNGRSTLREVDLRTGKVLRKVDVPQEYFAEGLTALNGKLYQLTWKANKGFTYDPSNFQLIGSFTYSGEGWGLTNDGKSLILSDGTNNLRFMDPPEFSTAKTISVYDKGKPLEELNELEYIKGEIYSNIWHDDRIVRIDPKSGSILGWIDLTGLLPENERRDQENVLNGIAYNEQTDTLYVTGKRWPKLFEIRLKKK
jgi:glutamine cyclotransferase